MKKKVLGKTNWRDSSITAILENEVYKGDMVWAKQIWISKDTRTMLWSEIKCLWK